MSKNKIILENDDMEIPFMKLRFNKKTGEMVEKIKGAPFLKGPIPMSWIEKVASLPGKVLHVALAIRWLVDMNQNHPVKLTRHAMEQFNFSADAGSDAIKILEREGLIQVQRLKGQRPWIKLMPMKNSE